jgi:hypothetical protein
MAGTVVESNKGGVAKKNREPQKTVHVFNKPIHDPRKFEKLFYLRCEIVSMQNSNADSVMEAMKTRLGFIWSISMIFRLRSAVLQSVWVTHGICFYLKD